MPGPLSVRESRNGELSLLSAAERDQIVREWNDTAADYPREHCLHQLFELQAGRTPDAPAVRWLDRTFSYRELNQRANQIAHRLRNLGVGQEVRVGICTSTGFDTVAALFGVLKAGGAYVPLDGGYPKERRRFMLDDAQVKVVLTQEQLRQQLPRHSAKVVSLDSEAEGLARESRDNPRNVTEPKNLAYVTYVSGPTGTPRGVAIEHRNVVALVDWAGKTFSAEELSGVLASNSIGSDISVLELFAPLCWGGTVILAENPGQLPTLAAREEIRMIHAAPSVLNDFLKAAKLPARPQTINLAAEPLSNGLLERLGEQADAHNINELYGATEHTGVATLARLGRCQAAQADGQAGGPAHHPIANTRIYILDNYQQPAPIGVAGEIYIGGNGVGRGYLNQPELTAQRFVKDPFSDDAAARLFRSGDRARYRSDGSIELLGRLDHQIRLRGYRIEPGEIEAVLGAHPEVRECAAAARPDESGETELVAFVVPNNGEPVDGSSLQRFLLDKLPQHMVPSNFVLPAGGTAPGAQPLPSEQEFGSQEQPAHSISTTEKILAEIWAEVIGLKHVGIHDNFFELGGHSVLVTQIISRVRKLFHVDLNLRTVFEAPTVAELAAQIEEALIAQIEELPEEEAQQLSTSAELVTQETT